jgi:GDPmannose 4,6-dehydratase
MTNRTALVTGANGQDAHYLASQLSASGWHVVGTSHGSPGIRRPAHFATIEPLDLTDHAQVLALVRRLRPACIFNVAARSSGAGMFDDPHATGLVNGHAVVSLLEAMRLASPTTRLFQASSSEMFGRARESPQSESTPFSPRSPYGAAKLYAHTMVRLYRERHGLWACSGILFNHESPRRGESFVSRKVCRGAAMIRLGLAERLELGNLEARRDWSHAADIVRAMRAMLEADGPRDYVIGSGRTRSVAEMCDVAFSSVGLDWRQHVRSGEPDYRPSEPIQLVADPSRIGEDLGWHAEIGFEAMVREMTLAELRRAEPENPT